MNGKITAPKLKKLKKFTVANVQLRPIFISSYKESVKSFTCNLTNNKKTFRNISQHHRSYSDWKLAHKHVRC
jgi:hypothetical protein